MDRPLWQTWFRAPPAAIAFSLSVDISLQCSILLVIMEPHAPSDVHTIEWRIVNFSSCALQQGEKLECLLSTAGNLYDTRWKLILYPSGKDDPDHLGCFIKRDDTEREGPHAIHVEFEFSLVAFDGRLMFSKRGQEEFKRCVSYGFRKFVELDCISSHKEYLLQSDTLKVRCKLRRLGPKRIRTSEQIFTTKFPVEKLSARLHLDDFRSICKRDPRVLVLEGTSHSLSLRVCMNKDDDSGNSVSIAQSYLHIAMTDNKSEHLLHVSCWIKVLKGNSDIAIDKRMSHVFSKTDKDKEWILPYFIDTNNVRDETLLLEFDLTICSQNLQSLLVADLTPLRSGKDPKETTLIEDLAELHATRTFSDATLSVAGETFPVHKCLLTARSCGFRRIFGNLTTDSEKQTVEITDVDRDTMALVLEFIYTDKIRSLDAQDMDDETCFSLYSAARKYEISSLQFRCVRLLKKNLSSKTVYKALICAEESNDTELKIVALDYIVENYEFVLLSDEWQALTEEHEELSEQVMRHLRLKKQQKLEE